MPVGINPVSGAPYSAHSNVDDSDLILSYERRLQEMLLTVQKQERDILYKEEEIRSIKNIARDLAEQLEPIREKEQQVEKIITEKQTALEESKMENESL